VSVSARALTASMYLVYPEVEVVSSNQCRHNLLSDKNELQIELRTIQRTWCPNLYSEKRAWGLKDKG
jgi:hypothetical protein